MCYVLLRHHSESNFILALTNNLWCSADPVFGFRLWTTCSEKGNISITCSVVSGDDVQFVWTWTLNGTSKSKASSGESQNLTIQFEDVIPEDLTCKASNAVSEIRARAPVCRGNYSATHTFTQSSLADLPKILSLNKQVLGCIWVSSVQFDCTL